ncbi:uroporphyrinogen-III C-methyltransferase [Anaerosporobacter sp.]|uniref:uroporphyrinogen-III C-methyltransferase n=1 Tax=Anaerosporobacter sp. TaxID=1872529 RepID=UPI00286F105C|nr:uroporphyrinogen-III C-methyltransferase [Anaerosporobacter sp.]
MEDKAGKVWLVGAGPGDIGLLTIKGKEILERAEVVVYDALVSDEIAAIIPSSAKKINVGKRANNHLVPQEEINKILLEEALDGKRVVRLKGGDPFVFGRGGEELELLVQHNIAYEVVPGITSAVSVAAYAGIPVTHRDFTSSVHIITGHARKGGVSRIQYDALVKMNATLVFLMGIGALEEICNSLMEAGMDENMPAAVLERGTSAKQRRVVATVATLKKEADEANIQTPAIIVVGQVCSLSNSFAWVEKQPLAGLQVVVTRPKEKSSCLTEKLRSQGAHVIEMPAIRTVTLDGENDIDCFTRSLDKITDRNTEQWILFTSPKGVESFFSLLAVAKKDIRQLYTANIRFGVVGNATRKELRLHGIEADYMPDTYCGRDLAKGLITTYGKDIDITLYRAYSATEELVEVLEENKMKYEDVAVYHTEYCVNEDLATRIVTGVENETIDYMMFTSASCVKATVSCLSDMNYTKIKAICIGEQTAKVANEYGMQVYISKKATIDSMVECLAELLNQ